MHVEGADAVAEVAPADEAPQAAAEREAVGVDAPARLLLLLRRPVRDLDVLAIADRLPERVEAGRQVADLGDSAELEADFRRGRLRAGEEADLPQRVREIGRAGERAGRERRGAGGVE